MTDENKTAATVWLPENRRHLISTAYDGTIICTPWMSGVRYVGPAQRAQANAHREAVRDHLAEHDLNLLSPTRKVAA